MLILSSIVVPQILPPKSFDGSGGQNINMSDSDFGAVSTSKIAISFWVKSSATTGLEVYAKEGASASDSSFKIAFTTYDASHTILQAFTFHGSSYNQYNSAILPLFSNWTHILVHLDPTNATSTDRIKVWINGSLDTPSLTSLTNNSSMNDSSANIESVYFGNAYKVYQPCLFSGALPSTTDVYNSGKPKEIRNVANLYSYIDTTSDNLTNDYVLTPNWTNSSVSLSTDIPT